MYGNQDDADLIDIPIRSDIIEMLSFLVISENNLINFKDYYSLHELFNSINFTNTVGSINNIAVVYYVEFIKFVLKERVINKVNNLRFLKGKLLESKQNNEFITILNYFSEISNDDLRLLREFISERRRFNYIYKNQEKLENLLLDLRTNSYDSLTDLSTRYENTISSLYHNVVTTKVSASGELSDIILDETGVETLAMDAYNELNTDGNTLSIGFKPFLDKTGGEGFGRGETILFGAPSGHGKSVLLLNIAWNIKRSNVNIITKDKTKKPLVIYYSMENTPRITYRRLAKLLLNYNRKDLKAMDPKAVAMAVNKVLTDNNSNVKLELVYRKSGTQGVQDLHTTIMERENEGYEVVAVCADYLKLFKSRSVTGKQELRHQMSEISRDLADLAIEKYFLAISAFQLNRGAIQSNKLDLSFVAEALSMIDHVDYAYLFKTGYDVDSQQRYLHMFDGKERSSEKSNNFTNDDGMFFLPFSQVNTIELMPTSMVGVPDTSTVIKTKATNTNIPTAPSGSSGFSGGQSAPSWSKNGTGVTGNIQQRNTKT